jgi:spermidine/putrescine ABC transporter ATP-binding subunit
MSYLRVSDLEHAYGTQRVLEDVSFSIDEGERLCLLGPSGCGKTTTLQVLAGFVKPNNGSVEIKGERIDGMPPEARNIGIMFQNYALFPHMSVFDNVAFGLRMRGVEREDIKARVMEALQLVRLPHAAAKKPAQLSGGEQQRIAFARAVVIRPNLLLLDEPFSNLDARLRLEMRTELLDLLRNLSIATVMVTHDQEEAMAIADRIAVMHRGRIEQVGTPSEIYSHPASLFVGRFIGESNVFDASLKAGSDEVIASVEGLGQFSVAPNPAVAGNSAQLMVRPEHIILGPASAAAQEGRNSASGTVEQHMFLGHRSEWIVRSGPHRITVWQSGKPAGDLRPGDDVTLSWPKENTLIVPAERAHA